MKVVKNNWLNRGWRFFKTNWFVSTLCVLALFFVARRYKWLESGSATGTKAKTEKYTDGIASASGESLMGIWPGDKSSARKMPEISDEESIAFLRRFQHVAIGERKKFGIPPSILLAAAYVNSFAGKRSTATEANNYFALGCGGDWDGPRMSFDERSFRKYNTPWESFRDYSITLAGQEWFGDVRKKSGNDWKLWTAALGDEDISDVEDFEQEMKKVIQTYRLFELDVQL